MQSYLSTCIVYTTLCLTQPNPELLSPYDLWVVQYLTKTAIKLRSVALTCPLLVLKLTLYDEPVSYNSKQQVAAIIVVVKPVFQFCLLMNIHVHFSGNNTQQAVSNAERMCEQLLTTAAEPWRQGGSMVPSHFSTQEGAVNVKYSSLFQCKFQENIQSSDRKSLSSDKQRTLFRWLQPPGPHRGSAPDPAGGLLSPNPVTMPRIVSPISTLLKQTNNVYYFWQPKAGLSPHAHASA